jgi:hypothetical protein
MAIKVFHRTLQIKRNPLKPGIISGALKEYVSWHQVILSRSSSCEFAEDLGNVSTDLFLY